MTTLKSLRDIVTFRGGGTPSKQVPGYWDGDIPWASVKDFTSTSLSETQDFISQEGLKNSSANLIPAGHVIIPTRMSLGKAAINTVDLAINQDLRALVPKLPVDTQFLLHAVLSLKDEIVKKGSGATVKGITQEELYKLELAFPPLDDQKRIAHLLGKVEGLIVRRKHHLQQLDDLLKSVFLEMFGDPVRNEKGWVKKLLQYLCHSPKDIKCGPFGTQLNKSEFQRSGVPVWGIPQINSEFAIPPHDFVTEEKAGQLEEYSVRHNDIVMSRKGTVGKCSLYPPSMQPGIMHSDVLRIRANWTKTNPVYLCWQLRLSRDVEKQIANVSSGAIMAGINVGKLKSITVFTPPIALQNQFAAIVEKVEGFKSRYQQSLTDLESLYGALSQKAFKGELDLSRVVLPVESTSEDTDSTEGLNSGRRERMRA